jgi:hypothetical protein
LRAIIDRGPVGFVAHVAVDLPVVGFMGVPRQPLAFEILRALGDVFVAPVTTEALIVFIFPLFQGGLKRFFPEFGDVVLFLFRSDLMAVKTRNRCFRVGVGQELGGLPGFNIGFDDVACNLQWLYPGIWSRTNASASL